MCVYIYAQCRDGTCRQSGFHYMVDIPFLALDRKGGVTTGGGGPWWWVWVGGGEKYCFTVLYVVWGTLHPGWPQKGLIGNI